MCFFDEFLTLFVKSFKPILEGQSLLQTDSESVWPTDVFFKIAKFTKIPENWKNPENCHSTKWKLPKSVIFPGCNFLICQFFPRANFWPLNFHNLIKDNNLCSENKTSGIKNWSLKEKKRHFVSYNFWQIENFWLGRMTLWGNLYLANFANFQEFGKISKFQKLATLTT